jgi:hypothetical protein|tara:strand:- start:967 stop:1182 length:216 start_codon:yes stop_codon:yes gene_type:complete
MLANKPYMTAAAYLLVLVAFGLMLSAIVWVPPLWVGVWVSCFASGMMMVLVAFFMFLHLLRKDAEMRRNRS